MGIANDPQDQSADLQTRIVLNAMLAGGAGLLGLITWLLTFQG